MIEKNYCRAWYLFKKATNICVLLLLVTSTSSYANVDLEKYTQDFVLETKKIEIAESPLAFNASIIRWNNDIWMSFREIYNPLIGINSAAESFLFIVKLDEEFNQVDKPIKVTFPLKSTFSRLEDARLIVVGNKLYMIYSDCIQEVITEGGFRVFVAELEYDGTNFNVIHNECLADFEGEDSDRREKNWVPFDYEGNLMLSYTLSPHKIFYPHLDGTGKCTTYITSRPSIVWEWGELRGGTQALLLNDDSYISFFHSCEWMASQQSEGDAVLHYFMGAYIFNRDAPFEITKISPEPIVGKNFYNGPTYEPYWKPVRVVFPCGFIINDDHFWVSYGRQDHEVWVAKLEKQGLLDSMIRVTTLK